MNRAQFDNPFLLGFECIEKLLERTAKADPFPPCNIEHVGEDRLKITLAVAGSSPSELAVIVEDNQLFVRGLQSEPEDKTFLHRGIASRQFQRSLILADSLDVLGAKLRHGLLSIEIERRRRENPVRTIPIRSASVQPRDAKLPI